MKSLLSARGRRFSNVCMLSAGWLTLSACGGDSGSSGSQTTVDDWRDYCIATFTEDYTVLDPFGDVSFTARTGEEYLVAELNDAGASELVYLAATGPDTFDVATSSGARPFTTNCTGGSTIPHLAVFSDTTVYAEEELQTPICELSAGTAIPRDTGSGSGYAITGSGAGTSRTYEVILNAFSAECGGADRGYVSVPETTLFGSRTWLVPIISIEGPG